MKIIESELFNKFDEIVFGFSTKAGLDRNAPFYFNLSKSVGDDEKIVDSNREAFSNALNIQLEQIVYQKQIHSDIIKIVKEPGTVGECDAMITVRPNLFLAATSADCPTIYLYDRKKSVIAAVHSGWRGTAKNILEKTIATMKNEFSSSPSNIYAFIAPSICQNNYEVGMELVNQFNTKYVKKIGEKYYLDLISANYDMLIEHNISEENIEVSQLCSFEELGLLHSYRREGERSGRAFGIFGMSS